jgi:hypothetical protein
MRIKRNSMQANENQNRAMDGALGSDSKSRMRHCKKLLRLKPQKASI